MTFEDYVPIYDGDRYCLMCAHACPVGRVTKRESTTPHGWALLIASVNRGLLQWDAETIDVLYQCADCGLCQANCATNRALPAAIVAARAEVVRLGVLPASVTTVDEKLRANGNPYMTNDGGRRTDSSTTSSTRYARSESAQNEALGLFVGDATLFLRPQFVDAAQKLLGEAALIGVGRSSGYLPYTLGLMDTARTFAQQTLNEIESLGVKEIITLSAEDAHTFKHVYSELDVMLPGDVRVMEFVECLAQKLEQGELSVRAADLHKSFTYHDPCHTPRLPGRARAARKLVRALMGSAPREMLFREKLATPCGAIGGLEFTQPKLAEKLARSRIAEAKSTGAEILLTDDPHCAAQLEKYADGLPVMNVIEMLADRVSV